MALSTVAEWSAAYDRIRARYPWLPEGVFTNWTASDRAFFTGLVNGRANFLVPLHLDVREQVMWHESGHTAHHQAAVLRDKAEGRGTAGDDIANEIAAILCGRSWTDPFDGLKNEYVAEAWRKANTGLTGPMGYPNPPGQREPYPTQELLTYFRTMAEPRVVTPSPENSNTPTPQPTEQNIADHWYSQFGLDSVSNGDCVPASMKSLLSLCGRTVPTIGAIRGVLGVPAGGVDLVTMRSGLAHYGIVGVVISSQDVPFDDVLSHVREGRPCVVFILYADIPNRVDPFGGLHAFVLASVDNNVGLVLDPANARDIPARYSLDDLRKAWDDGRTIGGGAFIPDEGGDMDRETFNQWFLEEYARVGAAAKFDELATQIGKTTKHTHTTGEPEAT